MATRSPHNSLVDQRSAGRRSIPRIARLRFWQEWRRLRISRTDEPPATACRVGILRLSLEPVTHQAIDQISGRADIALWWDQGEQSACGRHRRSAEDAVGARFPSLARGSRTARRRERSGLGPALGGRVSPCPHRPNLALLGRRACHVPRQARARRADS